MVTSSGGIVAYNLREGFRSEHLAHYALSAFGPTTPIVREDDHGIDLICHLMQRKGKMATVGSAYGVQVKSGDPVVEYKGPQVIDWLNSLQIPLFVTTVDKCASRIRIYSTWNLHRFLLHFENCPNDKRPDVVTLRGTDEDEAKLPEPQPSSGDIPIGKPILSFPLHELGDSATRDHHLRVLSEWVDMDRRNYEFRLAGVTMVQGYTKWCTNKHLGESQRNWYRPYYYSPTTCKKAKQVLAQAATVIGLFQKHVLGQGGDGSAVARAKEEFAAVKCCLRTVCGELLDDGASPRTLDSFRAPLRCNVQGAHHPLGGGAGCNN